MHTTDHPITKIVEESRVPSISEDLLKTFVPLFGEAKGIIAEALTVVVTDVSQVGAMERARDLRLKLREVRIKAENARRDMKDESLRTGQAIDKVCNAVKLLIAPYEQRMQDAETFKQRAQAEADRKRHAERAYILMEYGIDPAGYNLASMTDEAWNDLRESSRLTFERKQEEARKSEEARKAQEQADAAERERLRADNERLQKERDAKAKEADAARKTAADAQRKLDEQRAEEDRKTKEAERLARKAERAPDAQKLHAYATALRGIPRPTLKSVEAMSAMKAALRSIDAAIAALNQSAIDLAQ